MTDKICQALLRTYPCGHHPNVLEVKNCIPVGLYRTGWRRAELPGLNELIARLPLQAWEKLEWNYLATRPYG